MGSAKFTLLAVMAVAATNLRLTERWRERPARKLAAPAPVRKRRSPKVIASLAAHTPTGAVTVRGP